MIQMCKCYSISPLPSQISNFFAPMGQLPQRCQYHTDLESKHVLHCALGDVRGIANSLTNTLEWIFNPHKDDPKPDDTDWSSLRTAENSPSWDFPPQNNEWDSYSSASDGWSSSSWDEQPTIGWDLNKVDDEPEQ
jgi:hypothetical protein